MKNIIILGEEYWFYEEKPKYSKAPYLLNSLEFHRDKEKYNYIILENPGKLIETIDKIGINTIKAIFLFQDVLSDSYLNKKSILEMKNYLFNLKKEGIFLYPHPEVTDIFGSKKYNLTLSQKLPWAQLPHTKIYYVHNYDPQKDENKIFTGLYKNVEELWKIFKKVVVKKGYSYEGKQVKIFNKELIPDFYAFRKKARTLNFKDFWDVKTTSTDIDKGITRYYIIQGFNKIVSKRKNEYRILYNRFKSILKNHFARGRLQLDSLVKKRIHIPIMCNNNNAFFVWTERFDDIQKLGFQFHIESICRFVKYKNWARINESTDDINNLALPSRQTFAKRPAVSVYQVNVFVQFANLWILHNHL
jgi:hypothetical protein